MDEAKAFELGQDINKLSLEIYENADKKGFWGDEDEQYEIPRKLALIHAEVSEALEEHHRGKDGWEDRFTEEIADVIIRCLDLAAAYGHERIGHTIIEKHLVNLERPHLHGKRY